MLEDKMKSTDWDATYDAIEEAVARESYLTWLREDEKRAQHEKLTGSLVSVIATVFGKGSSIISSPLVGTW